MKDLIKLFESAGKDVDKEMEKVDEEIINLVVGDDEESREKVEKIYYFMKENDLL